LDYLLGSFFGFKLQNVLNDENKLQNDLQNVLNDENK